LTRQIEKAPDKAMTSPIAMTDKADKTMDRHGR